jgi:DNA-binding response OmpR family regulator
MRENNSMGDSKRRVFVVEDELTIAWAIQLLLEENSFEVIGPAGRVDAAMEIAASEDMELAVLDVNLRGEEVFPVADLLAERGVALLFLSGYEGRALPDRFHGYANLCKPARPEAVIAALDELVPSRGAPAGNGAAPQVRGRSALPA